VHLHTTSCTYITRSINLCTFILQAVHTLQEVSICAPSYYKLYIHYKKYQSVHLHTTSCTYITRSINLCTFILQVVHPLQEVSICAPSYYKLYIHYKKYQSVHLHMQINKHVIFPTTKNSTVWISIKIIGYNKNNSWFC
jgi:hypothetical protein